MTNEQRIRQVEFKRKKYIRSAVALIKKTLSSYTADLLHRVSGLTDLGLIEREIERPITPDRMADALTKIYVKVGSDFARWELKNIHAGKKAAPKPIEIDFWERYFESYARDNVMSKAVWITETTKSMQLELFRSTIDQINREGALDGESIWNMMKVYRERLGFTDQYRSERIARTETLRASNAGSFEGAKNAGIHLLKQWVPIVDNNSRDDHAAMAGEPAIELDQLFNVGGESMMIPGDGSAENTINCRCIVSYIPETNEQMFERWDREDGVNG